MLLTAYKIINAITGVNTGSKVFTVAGDKLHLFLSAGTFTIAGSTGNDGTYTIASDSVLNGSDTDITVNEAIPNATADGNIEQVTGIEVLDWKRADLSGNDPFKYEATVSAGYSDISFPDNFDKYYESAKIPYKDMRNELISTFISQWGSLSTDDQKAMVKNYVYPDGTSRTDLDALSSQSARLNDQKIMMELLNLSCTCNVRENTTIDHELTGTVSVTAGTAAVTGVATKFLSEISVGDNITIAGESFTASVVTDDLNLTLSANHVAGASAVKATSDNIKIYSDHQQADDSILTIVKIDTFTILS